MITKITCIICMGSNYKPNENLSVAITHLTSSFPDIIIGTPVITPAEGKPVHHSQQDYTNQAARFTTTRSIESIKQEFKHIEHICGRTPQSKSHGIIPLDIDILIYGETILKPHDLDTSYVRLALAAMP